MIVSGEIVIDDPSDGTPEHVTDGDRTQEYDIFAALERATREDVLASAVLAKISTLPEDVLLGPPDDRREREVRRERRER